MLLVNFVTIFYSSHGVHHSVLCKVVSQSEVERLGSNGPLKLEVLGCAAFYVQNTMVNNVRALQ